VSTTSALRETWGRRLAELATDDERVVVLDGDLANSTKADRFAEAHPDRFLEMGIAEQNLVGVAAGLASIGYVPWLSSFAVFFTHRALDPIRMLVAQTGANVKIAAAYSGLLTGLTGKTHQDVEDLAIMRAMPGMTVLAPADSVEGRAMIDWATDYDGPVYLRLARDPAPEIFAEPHGFEPGAVHALRPGDDVALVSTGVQTTRVLEAAELLALQGLSASVTHVPCLKPLDEEALHALLEPASQIVTVEEHTVLGGLGGLVAEVMSARAGAAPVSRIGIEDCWGESAPNDALLEKYGLSAQRVAARVVELLATPAAAPVR
jgi:transketolase